jgi:hypothetical protein
MRKMLKKKARACAMCKPFKRGKCNRWKPKELARLKEDDKSCRESKGEPGE